MRRSAYMASKTSDWRDSAACRHHDPDLFFPEGTDGPALRQASQAKQVCQRCPVRTPCLRFAIRFSPAFGVWGGATREERRAIGRAVDRESHLFHFRLRSAPATTQPTASGLDQFDPAAFTVVEPRTFEGLKVGDIFPGAQPSTAGHAMSFTGIDDFLGAGSCAA
jgi:WhiB family redox-sensing transcriptional regulator